MRRLNLLKRNIKTFQEPKEPKFTFSVFQWNTLASCAAQTWKYPTVPSEYVGFDYRKDMLAQEIKSFAPDIVCLEEVDQKDVDYFNSIFDENEYYKYFSKKNSGEDGVCLFVNKKFEVVESESLSHLKPNGTLDNQVSRTAVLKFKKGNEEYYVLVGVAHLQAFAYLDWIRKRQATQLIAHLEKKKQEYSKLLGGKTENICVVICGDLNALPDSSPIQQLKSSQELNLKSVFDNEKYTVYRIFPIIPKLFSFGIPYKGTVDYILHSGNLTLTKKTEEAADEEIGNIGLLSDHYPSDHLSLYCEFTLE